MLFLNMLLSQTGKLSEPLLLGFYEDFITLARLIKPLAKGDNSTSRSSPFTGGKAVGLKVLTRESFG